MNGVTIVKVNGERNENKIHAVGSAVRPLSAVHHPPSSQNGYFINHLSLKLIIGNLNLYRIVRTVYKLNFRDTKN